MRLFLTCAVAVASLVLSSCDENLPPQDNPTLLFTSSTSTQYLYTPDTSPSQSYIDIYFVYKNLYDETLEDAASMKGSISIEWIAPPEDRGSFNPIRTDQLTFDNLFFAKRYNFATNSIIIDPKDSVVIRYRWNLKTDDSTSLIRQVKYIADKNCFVTLSPGGFPGYRQVSVKQMFRVSAKFIIFQRGGTITTSSTQFSACWIAPHYGEPSPCDQPNPQNPCTVIQP